MSPRIRLGIFVGLCLAAFAARAAELHGAAARHVTVALVDAVAARNSLALTGSWDVLVPEQVIDTGADDVPVAVTLYALREGADVHALLLTQRNVLPGVDGWGAPAACGSGAAQPSVTVYQSPRDVLCGWARTVSFSSQGRRAQLGAIAQIGLGAAASRFGSRAANWLWVGLRVSNRSDFLDIQLLMPDDPEIPQTTIRQFLADMAHSMDTTWLTNSLAAVPSPPTQKPEEEPTGSWWSGTLSTSAMKTTTYRVGVSIKTFLVASVMAGDAATGGAIIAVLNFTSTGIYLVNDYLWETWRPLAPPPQDFVQLVYPP